MNSPKILLVEGFDDQHVIWALLKFHAIPQTFSVDEKKGVDNLFKTFSVLAKASGVEAIAAVVDADVDAASRWTQIRSIATKLGYATCPVSIPSAGLILNEEGLPRFGAWVMPDNSLSGMLEDFIGYLIPEGDKLWAHVSHTVHAIPNSLVEFKAAHKSKAQIHTWLAWKEDPGTPMGLAITKKWLNPESASAVPFLNWIRLMFVH